MTWHKFVADWINASASRGLGFELDAGGGGGVLTDTGIDSAVR
jgi:hypothetical protein